MYIYVYQVNHLYRLDRHSFNNAISPFKLTTIHGSSMKLYINIVSSSLWLTNKCESVNSTSSQSSCTVNFCSAVINFKTDNCQFYKIFLKTFYCRMRKPFEYPIYLTISNNKVSSFSFVFGFLISLSPFLFYNIYQHLVLSGAALLDYWWDLHQSAGE